MHSEIFSLDTIILLLLFYSIIIGHIFFKILQKCGKNVKNREKSPLPLNQWWYVIVFSTLVFEKIAHAYPTRSQSIGLQKIPRVSTCTYGLKSLFYQAILQWNNFQRMFFNENFANNPLVNLRDIVKTHFLDCYSNHP